MTSKANRSPASECEPKGDKCESKLRQVRNPTAKARKMVENIAVHGMSKSDAYREAYGKPNADAKTAGTLAGRVLSKPGVTELLDKLQNGVEEAVVEKRAVLVVDHQEEVRANFRTIIEQAIEKGEYDVAIKANEMLGSMDGCGNFLDQKPLAEAAGNTSIHINGMSPLDAIRDTLRETKQLNGTAH